MSQPHLFIFGLGIVGERLARTVAAKGWNVTGTTRSEHRAHDFIYDGIYALIFRDKDSTGHVGQRLQKATHILNTIPPAPSGHDPVFPFLHARLLSPHLKWIGLLSSAGVYGDMGGHTAYENTRLHPLYDEAIGQAFCEANWRALFTKTNRPLHVFRLSAVYCDNRNPLVWIPKRPVPLIEKDGLIMSRTHLDDVVMALLTSMENPKPGALYNLSDDEPAQPQDVTTYAYKLLGIEPPAAIPYDPSTLPEMIRVHYEESRRVSAEHIKQDLGITWQFPSYREGLKHIFEQRKAKP